MSDEELVDAFEGLTLDPRAFRHVDHVRLAFAYMRRHDLFEALARFRSGLKRFTEHHGASDKYHETVTCALVVLIHERMAAADPGDDWDDFAAANPDLLTFRDGVFFEYYDVEVLDSEIARRTFVLPTAARSAGRPRPAGDPTARRHHRGAHP